MDLEGGGVLCPACARGGHGLTTVSARAIDALGRLRTMAWDEAIAVRLGSTGRELRDILDGQIARLADAPARVPKFLREVSAPFVTGQRG